MLCRFGNVPLTSFPTTTPAIWCNLSNKLSGLALRGFVADGSLGSDRENGPWPLSNVTL
jgi:hypothetical protein